MNKLPTTLIFLFFVIIANANSLFDSEKKYFITCYDLKKGGIEPSSEGEYPLIYNHNSSEYSENALWIITEEEPDKYSIKNSKTGYYIEYAPNNTSGKFIKMSTKQNDNSTLFTIQSRKTVNNIVYWTIAPVNNPKVIFDKRKYGAVGTYQALYNDNQLFSFKEQNGDYIKKTSLIYLTNGYFNSFKFDGIELAYDKKSKTFFCSIPIDEMNSNIKKLIHYIPTKPHYKIKIENQNIQSGTTFSFNNVTAEKVFNISILDKENIIHSSKLVFTGLPIIQLYTEENKWNNKFASGKIKVTEYNQKETGEILDIEIRYRGATALSYSKKSFAIKLKDTNKKSINRSYFGLRNDNYWILDAMASDPSRMRNRICFDLWNDFSSSPYFSNLEKNVINGTRGQYVEVFLDNQYWGLYCMTERIDRKQLQLKKYEKNNMGIRGVLYKSAQWSNSTMMGKIKGNQNSSYNIPNYSQTNDKWDGYEIKYPDLSDKQAITWKPLYDMISFVSKSNNSSFKNNISNTIDMPVWLDYYLFLELIYAQDNHGKNAYFYIYDITLNNKMGITPWDLDGTWGRSWNRLKTNSSGNLIHFFQSNYGEHHVYRRLKETNAENYNSLIKQRYNQLKSGYFAKKNLVKRVDDYLNLFSISGAKAREEKRWNGVNNVSIQLDTEIAYMKKWISERVDFLDRQYRNN